MSDILSEPTKTIDLSLTAEEAKVMLHCIYQQCGMLNNQITILCSFRQPTRFAKPLEYYRREYHALTSIETKIYDAEKRNGNPTN